MHELELPEVVEEFSEVLDRAESEAEVLAWLRRLSPEEEQTLIDWFEELGTWLKAVTQALADVIVEPLERAAGRERR